jgi:predicted O-methyltransferase YrrM
LIAVVTAKPASEIEGYINEAIDDQKLRAWFDDRIQTWAGAKTPANVRSPFGRRLGWYAVTRAIKPKILIETGVDRGHGALVLCAALLRNAAEGHPGRYYGTDLRPEAGYLLGGPYASMGQILVGDSIESLKKLAETVDLFINDSDHSAEYEASEYRIIAPKLSPRAIILGDNAHATDKLARFSRITGRQFLFFREEPQDHWYPGAGIGISFPRM